MSGDLKSAMSSAEDLVSESALLTSVVSLSWAEFKKGASEQDVILAVEGVLSLKPHIETMNMEIKTLLGTHAIRAKKGAQGTQ
eukprot:2360916-Pyramimonas_sp.AAC.1